MTPCPDRGRRSEIGETLAEVLVALAILSVAVVTIVGSMGTAVTIATRHRTQTVAGTILLSAADAVKDQARNPYAQCPASYDPTTGVGVPSGWAVAVPGGGVLYWDATALAFQSSCPATDGMLQKVTVRVTAPNGYVDKVDVVKRNPA